MHHRNAANEQNSPWTSEQLQFYKNMINTVEPNEESGINIFGELLRIDSADVANDEAVDINLVGQPRTPFQLTQ